MGDAGAVLCGGVWLMWITHKKDPIVFKKWKWSAFSIFLIWCIGQNILVEMFLYHDQLADDKLLSWAPLSPFGPYFPKRGPIIMAPVNAAHPPTE